jgi:hypothetical protein
MYFDQNTLLAAAFFAQKLVAARSVHNHKLETLSEVASRQGLITRR